MIASWFGFKNPTAKFLYGWAVANVAANVLLVVTGGGVRVTGSGLGCPTWPQCTSGNIAPVPGNAMGIHSVIEFGNRLLTWVLVAVAVATFVAAIRRRPVDRLARTLALVVALGVPLQGVIGGITVLTNLNPWVVSLHFVATMVIISVATWLAFHVRPREEASAAATPSPVFGRVTLTLTWLIYVTTWIAIYVGTIVTGSGPHSGDDIAMRNGLRFDQLAVLHADAVWVLVGLSIALTVLVVAAQSALRRATLIFGAVILLQGLIGYVQYVLHVPAGLVILHMFGAAVLMIGATHLVLSASRTR
ncbi:COX15/CtaA family protein [Gordonia hydrophobica]|uniref:COX15/CtaA family protein n=1 Tax=Gordonia hydrophobica TaxID=40516 RepID=A0ABZ2U350_9ACTN|nr:COX15/CtaA family protein [Gordonia hydrophobica]MBM7369136.1 cytochrome c oxidase assembly protein subunit 15 [Gordonia hydrophobica]